MHCAEPFEEEPQEKIYSFNLDAFAEVPDEVLKGMYTELKKFFAWYRLKGERLLPEHQPDFDAAEKKFLERFICTWKKYK